MSDATEAGPCGLAPTVNMSWEYGARQRRPPDRPNYVPVTHADMPLLTDNEVRSVRNYETRQDRRDLNFMTPPVPQGSDNSETVVPPRTKPRAPDTRSPTLAARDKTPELQGSASKSSRERSTSKRKETSADATRQTPRKRHRKDEKHVDRDLNHEDLPGPSNAQQRYEFDDDEIADIGCEMVSNLLADSQASVTQTQSTGGQPVSPASSAEREVDDYILNSCEDKSTASESEFDCESLDTAFIHRKCDEYDENRKRFQQLKEERRSLCDQLSETLDPEAVANKLDAVRTNGEAIEDLQKACKSYGKRIADAIESWCLKNGSPLGAHGARHSDILDTNAVRRYCDSHDLDQKKIDNLLEHQKQLVAKLCRCVRRGSDLLAS